MTRLAVQMSVLSLALAGCSESPVPLETAEVRLLHASPDAPPLDLYLGPRNLLLNNVSYGNASAFQSVGVGSQQLIFTRAGAPQDQFRIMEVDFKKGEKVDLVAVGETHDRLHVVVVHETSTPPDAGTVRLRLLNASPDGTPMSVDLGNDGNVEIPDFALFNEASAPGLEIRAGSSLPLGIVTGGTVASFSIPPLPAGSDALLVPTGYVARAPREYLGLSILVPGLGLLKQAASLYFGHLVSLPGIHGASLDIYNFGSLTQSDLRFGELIRVPDRNGAFSVKACPHGAPPVSPSCFPIGNVAYSFSMQPAHRYLVLVHFKVEDFLSTFFDDTFDFGQPDPQLRFIDSAGCCTVDVGLVDDGLFTVFDGYSPINYLDGAVSSGPVLSPGMYTLGFRWTGDTTVYGFETVLKSGSHSFAIIGPGTDGPQLYLIDTATQPWNPTVLSPLP